MKETTALTPAAQANLVAKEVSVDDAGKLFSTKEL